MFNYVKRCLLCLGMCFWFAHVSAAPVISSVDTAQYQSEGLVTIIGNGFGSSAKVHLLDDFEHGGANVGGVVSLNKARQGSWAEHGTNPPLYDDFARSGSFSARMAGPDVGMRQIKHSFSQPVQSVFVSYWVAIPSGYPFPGNDDDFGGFPSNSAWKFAWLIDKDYLGESSDTVVPTYVGSDSALIGGNDGNITYIAKPSQWWSWGGWMRISALLYANPNAPTSSGRVLFEVFSRDKGFYVLDLDIPVYDADGPPPKQYQTINFPGWLANFSLGEARPLYDDIYIASGQNAAARVELSDDPDYERSNYFTVMQIESWSDTRIEARVAPMHRQSVTNPVFHVFDGAGRRSGSGDNPPPPPPPPPPEPPNPPTNVTTD